VDIPCNIDANFHTIIEGVRTTTQFNYLDIDRIEISETTVEEGDTPKPWLYYTFDAILDDFVVSDEDEEHAKLDEIIYVELKLDLVFLDGTTSYSTIVFPERKVTL
jgi:hypothetical protein